MYDSVRNIGGQRGGLASWPVGRLEISFPAIPGGSVEESARC